MKRTIIILILITGISLSSNAQIDTLKRNDTSALKTNRNDRNKPKEEINRKDSNPMDDKTKPKRYNPKTDSIPKPRD